MGMGMDAVQFGNGKGMGICYVEMGIENPLNPLADLCTVRILRCGNFRKVDGNGSSENK